MSSNVPNADNFNQRQEVPAGAYVNIRHGEGGRLFFDGVEFVPSGGGGGSFDPTITNPQDGDVIARVGGAWVNSGNLKIGASAQPGDGVALTDGVERYLSLDPAHIAAEFYRFGLALNDAKDGWITTASGRYAISAIVYVQRDAAQELVVYIELIGSNGEGARALLSPSVVDTHSYTVAAHCPGSDLPAGYTLQMGVRVDGADTTLVSGYFAVRYVGPATSL